MADKQWVSTDGDFGAAASWNPAAVPTSGDSFIFDGIGSQLPVSSGLDQQAIASAMLVTRPPYKGQIGTSTDPLHIGIPSVGLGQERRAIIRGRGDCYLKQTAGDFGNVVVDAPHARVFLNGSWSHVAVKAGYCEMNAAATIQSRLIVAGKRARVVVNDGILAPPWIIISDGLLEWIPDWVDDTNWLVGFGGKVVFTGRFKDDNDLTPAATPHIFLGKECRLEYRPTAALGAFDTPPLVCAGIFDVSQNTQDVELSDRFYLPTARVLGAPVHRGDVTFNGTDMDLRKDYP